MLFTEPHVHILKMKWLKVGICFHFYTPQYFFFPKHLVLRGAYCVGWKIKKLFPVTEYFVLNCLWNLSQYCQTWLSNVPRLSSVLPSPIIKSRVSWTRVNSGIYIKSPCLSQVSWTHRGRTLTHLKVCSWIQSRCQLLRTRRPPQSLSEARKNHFQC